MTAQKAVNKTFRIINDGIDRIVVLLFLAMLLIGAYTLYDTWYIYHQAGDRSYLAYRPEVDEETGEVNLGVISDECVAWLTIDDTNIDYPIMQASDNMKYLNMNPYGEYSLSGSIFMDCRNNPEFTDEYTLIYGHHMEAGAMFGALDKYMDKEYYDSHKTGRIIVNGRSYPIEIFAASRSEATETVTFNPPLSEGLKEYLEEHAIFYDGFFPDRIIGLSTCMPETVTSRFLVFAYITVDMRPIETRPGPFEQYE